MFAQAMSGYKQAARKATTDSRKKIIVKAKQIVWAVPQDSRSVMCRNHDPNRRSKGVVLMVATDDV
jgi:hypothetical protein